MANRSLRIAMLLPALLLAAAHVRAADPFRDTIHPFLKSYCFECHSAKKSEGELNLARFESAAMLAEDFRPWEHVVTFLKKGEMPPAEAKQPTPAERAELLRVLQELMKAEARKMAGDPGVVPPRRLSNPEFNYSIRDLTGFDLRPADSFPVDPTSGEGFSNTGEALAMSPSLFKKYYAAAQWVAEHVDFTPAGWDFAPYPVATYADQKKFHEQALLDFYSRHEVRYEAYLAAAWTYRFRTPDQKGVTIEQWATERKLSPKYFASLVKVLEGAGGQHYAGWIRERWQALLPADRPAEPVVSRDLEQQLRLLADDLRRLGVMLAPPETQAIVSNAGNGPIEHIDRRTKTAAARDTFNAKLLSASRRFHVEVRGLGKTETIRVFLEVSPVEPQDNASEGYVLLKEMNFSTSNSEGYKPADDKRNLPLKEMLEKHAPDQLERLKFGKHPLGHAIEAGAAAIKLGSLVELQIPRAAFPDTGSINLYAEARLDREHSKSGMARFTLAVEKPTGKTLADRPFPLVDPEHPSAAELRDSCAALCAVLPNRFCYVDDTRGLSAGFHLIEGFFRDDQPLCRHVLSEAENHQLDRLWDELNFGTHIWEKMLRGFVFFERSERNFMKHADFDSFKEEDPELATQESVERLEQAYFKRSGVKGTAEQLALHPIHTFFAAIRQGLERRDRQSKEAQPAYLRKLEKFAESAYRRPLAEQELKQLRDFFHKLCEQKEYGVEQAVRASLTRALVSPHFCYRVDVPPAGPTVEPLSDLALASRLSYFLWSSLPDEELLAVAKAGKLKDEAVLLAQTRRMLKDAKVQGFALEFFGPWLRYRDFNDQESVSREVFPAFDDALKQAMFEEPTRLAAHLIQQDRPVLDLLTSDTTLVNKKLAQHYGVPHPGGDAWIEVTGMHQKSRSGLLGMAVFLTKNSQPQRTSPVKRGFWVVHHLLGEHIPPPPADVAVLPAKETDTNGKTIRELLALHTDDAKCARCHQRFDAVGLSMEGFDAIGRIRSKDLAGRSIDNLVSLPSGKQARGVPEFAQHLAAERSADFTRTLARKFLGNALGRSLVLSDQPLLEAIEARLQANQYRFSALFETVVASPQFRNQRCREFTAAAFRKATSEN